MRKPSIKRIRKIVNHLRSVERVINIRHDDDALESYQVCLKMLFVDLEELNDPRVSEVLRHYSFTWVNGRVGLELPRLRPGSQKANK